MEPLEIRPCESNGFRRLPVARRPAEIGDAHGFHLRPAARYVEVAQRFAAEIRVRCKGADADGEGVIGRLGLAAEGGMMLEVEAEEAVAALADVIWAIHCLLVLDRVRRLLCRMLAAGRLTDQDEREVKSLLGLIDSIGKDGPAIEG
jgi:phosphotransferase system HPr (HPr) family protein